MANPLLAGLSALVIILIISVFCRILAACGLFCILLSFEPSSWLLAAFVFIILFRAGGRQVRNIGVRRTGRHRSRGRLKRGRNFRRVLGCLIRPV